MSNTAHRNYPKPVAEHNVSDDVALLQQAMDLVDGDIHLLFAAVSGLAPVTHEHVIANIQGLSAALAGKAAIDHSHTLEALSDVSGTLVAPAGYLLVKQVDGTWGPASPASVIGAHQHVIGDIQNLQVALDAALATNINAAADEAPADTAMLGFRKADGSLIKRSWANVKTLLASTFAALTGALFTGEVKVNTASGNNLRMWGGGSPFGYIFRSDATSMWLLVTANGDHQGGYNALRPLQINGSTGEVAFGNAVSMNGAVGGSAVATFAQYRANTPNKLLATDQVWASAAWVNLGGALAGNLSLDLATFLNGYGTLSANVTLNGFTNGGKVASYLLSLWNPSTYSLSLDTTFFKTGSAGITLAAGRNLLSLVLDADGKYVVTLVQKGMA